jgi:hypothetical protein
MFKPAMAAVIGLVCVAVAVTGTGGLGISGADGRARVGATSIEEFPDEAASSGRERSFAHVPASHAAYGWRYPYAFR